MIIYTNSWNTDDCILWKLINSTQHTRAQSTTKTVHNPTCFIVQGCHQKKSPFLSHGNFWYLGHFHIPKQLRKTKYQSFNRAIHTSFCTTVYIGPCEGNHQLEEKLNSLCTSDRGNLWQCFNLSCLPSSWKEMFRCMRLQHSQGPKCTGFLSSEWIYLLNSSHRCPQ